MEFVFALSTEKENVFIFRQIFPLNNKEGLAILSKEFSNKNLFFTCKIARLKFWKCLPVKKRIVLGFFKDMRKGDQSRIDRWVCGWIGRWREVGIGRWLANFR